LIAFCRALGGTAETDHLDRELNLIDRHGGLT